MSLTKCPECGGTVSTNASTCPSCGYRINSVQHGAEFGKGLKQSIKGLNTLASPKSLKKCIILSLIPLISFLICYILLCFSHSDFVIGLFMIPAFTTGLTNFYVGKIKKGIIYTLTVGVFFIGIIKDLIQLTLTKTYRDSNGFPVIY